MVVYRMVYSCKHKHAHIERTNSFKHTFLSLFHSFSSTLACTHIKRGFLHPSLFAFLTLALIKAPAAAASVDQLSGTSQVGPSAVKHKFGPRRP